MTLLDAIKVMVGEDFTLPKKVGDYAETERNSTLDLKIYGDDLDDEEYAICSPESILLVPWYDCEVAWMAPGGENIMDIYLKDGDYLIKKFSKHIKE